MSFDPSEEEMEQEQAELRQYLHDRVAGRRIVDVQRVIPTRHNPNAESEDVPLVWGDAGFEWRAVALCLDDGTKILLDRTSFGISNTSGDSD